MVLVLRRLHRFALCAGCWAASVPIGVGQADVDRITRGVGGRPERGLELVLPRGGRRDRDYRAFPVRLHAQGGWIASRISSGFRISDFWVPLWLAWLPFLLPGVLLGIGLIWLFNRPWSALLYQSAGIVILAFVIRYLAVGLERRGPRLADGGPRFERRRAAGRRDALADAAPRALAANRAASRRGLVYRLPALPVGRGIHDPGRAARRRDPGAARLQPAALRPQRAGERALPDAAGAGGCAVGSLEGVVRGATGA